MASSPTRKSTSAVPAPVPINVFPAFDDVAVYVPGTCSRSEAITEARGYGYPLDEYQRRDLRVRRVFMRAVSGPEADEAFCGEFDNGWIEVRTEGLNEAQRASLIPMWIVEPKP